MQADISKLETEGRNPTETSSAPASNYLSAYLYDILYMSNIYLYDITGSTHHEHNSTVCLMVLHRWYNTLGCQSANWHPCRCIFQLTSTFENNELITEIINSLSCRSLCLLLLLNTTIMFAWKQTSEILKPRSENLQKLQESRRSD